MNYKFKSFDIDHNLLFVIQNYEHQSTEEILSTLHEAATSIVSESLKSTRASILNKRSKFFYKKSEIPILMCCTSAPYKQHEKWHPGQPLAVNVEVRFPKKILRMKPSDLEALAGEKFEKSIGLRDEITKFAALDKPEVQLPRGLKDVL